jgi:prevent-host-death family protein
MATKTVDVSEAQSQLQELLPLVKAGTEVVLTEGNTPVARLIPIGQPPSTRVPGLHPGAFWISEDFDEPLPDEFWTGAT